MNTKLRNRLVAAVAQGIRSNPKLRSVTPDELARYAVEDATAILALLGDEKTPAKQKPAQEIVQLRAALETRGKQIDGLAARLASVLWSMPNASVILSDEHTKKLEGRSWEIREAPAGDGRTLYSLDVKPLETPMPAGDEKLAEAMMTGPRRVPADGDRILDAAKRAGMNEIGRASCRERV